MERRATRLGLVYDQRCVDTIELAVWHRFGYRRADKWIEKGYAKNAEGVADILEHETNATKQKMGYHLVINPYGIVEQALPFSYVAPHAISYNETSIGIAVIGDFRYNGPTDAAWDSAIEVSAMISRRFTDRQFGHTELPGSSDDPDKICPGHLWPMGELLAASGALRDSIDRNEADKEMRRLGFIF